ncbi:DNA-directed RNA polymerase, mitochondrial-like isoform X1 [Oncorhynchus nerka]|uniref:DNA-directed RNA polymerase, mitochondrial-like isoform X1 n=2 Tax=Oncorhynchus nerka TaxID=8023 RepID=UPI001131FEFF|nr:DNA-directed RNA polymerase, mitochondrial-like isoform X1 [Oncorhynchus nerka]
MSLLRLCAFPKCLSGRILLEISVRRVPYVDHCLTIRNNIERHISEPPWTSQRRHFSALIPKKEDGKKRVWEQSQLLDVLEARIQQLQSDVIVDVQQEKVQFVKASKSGIGASSGNSPKNVFGERTEVPKAGQTVSKGGGQAVKGESKDASASKSRWMEKLSQEKKTKTKKLKQKLGLEDKPVKSSKGKLMLPGTSHKTISTKAGIKTASTVKKSKSLKNQEHTMAASKHEHSMAAAPVAAANVPIRKAKGKGKASKEPAPELSEARNRAEEMERKAEAKARELAEVEELERKLNQWAVSARPELVQDNSEARVYGDVQRSVRCYLEACVFCGDIDRAHRFLLSHHRMVSRRNLLNIGLYNIMMRVWAKKGSLNQIGRMFILIEEAGLKPNLGSYCAALECMGRNPDCSPHVINRVLRQMEEDGLPVDELFSHCVFRQDERDMVLRAIHTVQPDFQSSINTILQTCSSPLVKDFYTERADAKYPKMAFSLEELQERFSRQLSIEQASTITIHSVEAMKPVTSHMAKMRDLLAVQRLVWHKALVGALREGKIILASSTQKAVRLSLYPYLCLLDEKDYVDIMIQSLSNLPPSGESLHILAKELGNRVHNRFCIRMKGHNQMVDKLSHIYNEYTELLAKDSKEFDVLPRERWWKLEAEHSSGPSLLGDETHWPHMVVVELGTYLVDLMVKHMKVNSDLLNSAYDRKLIPVLYHMYTFRSNKQVGFIKPHPILTQMQQDAMDTTLTFDSYVMPMLCPPVPWTSAKFGAYLLTPTKMMRAVEGANQHEILLEKCQDADLHAVLDSLNQLGNAAWRINQPLLDIIISIFNDKGSEKLDVPPPNSEAPKIPRYNQQDSATFTSAEKAHLKREVVNAKKKCSEMHSLRMDALYKLSIANHMRDEVFWFPHNMDFRGRTYPCPPYFNHLGSDVTRAVLVFAEGKPLGPGGLQWLKIHLVNLTGLKKRSSLAGRLEYANTIMEDILDSADNPLIGKKWWQNADEPWQTLACCMEIANAVRSPDPTHFISHFPVHQDGSCNGLQHYAALGRDVIGATSVNLIPCEVPQDVYSGVAQQVEEFRVRDAEKGLKIAQVLEGFISRKVVKQTVMTVVYGVTRYGGRLQIEKRLKEIDDFPKEYVWDASHYLVHQVFSSLKEMFTGTREIQDWLTESARLISKSGSTVEWVTPLGLPIIQPYHRSRTQMLKATIQYLSFQITHDSKERPDTVKQKNAFPPNFIHSLDSTHMMLTALYCYSAGLTFVSVHDCFWTHAITVDTMNKVCREQFVALHSQPILQELSNFLLKKYCSGLQSEVKSKKFLEYRRMLLLLAKVPQTGNFDLQRVKESTYFFS